MKEIKWTQDEKAWHSGEIDGRFATINRISHTIFVATFINSKPLGEDTTATLDGAKQRARCFLLEGDLEFANPVGTAKALRDKYGDDYIS